MHRKGFFFYFIGDKNHGVNWVKVLAFLLNGNKEGGEIVNGIFLKEVGRLVEWD